MMSELFDEEYQREQYDIAVKRIEREEGKAEGKAEGMEKGMEKGLEKGRAEGLKKGLDKGKNELVKSLLAVERSIKEIAEFFKTDESEIRAMLVTD